MKTQLHGNRDCSQIILATEGGGGGLAYADIGWQREEGGMELAQFVSVTNGTILFSHILQASNVLRFWHTLFSSPCFPVRWLPAAHRIDHCGWTALLPPGCSTIENCCVYYGVTDLWVASELPHHPTLGAKENSIKHKCVSVWGCECWITFYPMI